MPLVNSESISDVDRIFNKLSNIHYQSSTVYKEVHSKQAWVKIKENELEAIYHLTESHSPLFRYSATALYEKSLRDLSQVEVPLIKDNFKFECANADLRVQIVDMLERIEEMPPEWTLVQLTPAYNIEKSLVMQMEQFYSTEFHITMFNCGQNSTKPYAVFVDKPRDHTGSGIPILEQIKQISIDEKLGFDKYKVKFANQQDKDAYADFRYNLNESMKSIVKCVQTKWIKAWRILLIGKYKDPQVELFLDNKLEAIIKENNICISEKSKLILKCLARGISFLDLRETKSVVQYCLKDEDSEIQRIVIKELIINCVVDPNEKRHPVILIVDESIDTVPWEMMDVMLNQPASRMQSLHFTYALYKEYEADIVDGWKVNVNHEKGAYVVNPNQDLERMERRLVSFFNYWTPAWDSVVARQPSNDEFLNIITKNHIFSYNGHGNGFQYICSNKIQKLRINAVVLLFGCSSAQLKPVGPQCGHYGQFQSYITACSPCVVGMLWTVVDADTDLLSTDLISRWIPSKAPIHWRNMDKQKWLKGLEDLPANVLSLCNSRTYEHEPELLTALLLARKTAKQYLTQAGCVARGIPVKIG